MTLRRRIRVLTWIFIAGLILSGATAIPLAREVDWLAQITDVPPQSAPTATTISPGWSSWLMKVRSAIDDTTVRHPFLFYGTDWLAFGHFVIALAFVGALRDPVRNKWLFEFAMWACALVVPYALVFGAVRSIPIFWRLIDCSFGAFGIIPVWLCWRWARELGRQK